MVRYRTRPEAAEENRRLIEQVFAQLAAEDPGGIRYSAYQLEDGVTFVHLVVSEDGADPLPALSAFAEFQKGIGERLADGPERVQCEVVGAYRAA